VLFILTTLTVLTGFAQAPAGQSMPIVRVDERIFPVLANMDGNWSVLLVGSDGKVYLGLAYHRGDGPLVYYDSKTNQMHDVGALTVLCGEQFLSRGPQPKIRTRFGEGKDGRIYFAAHYGNDFHFARFATKEGYPGDTGWLKTP
jgi:hypothetical protein